MTSVAWLAPLFGQPGLELDGGLEAGTDRRRHHRRADARRQREWRRARRALARARRQAAQRRAARPAHRRPAGAAKARLRRHPGPYRG
ncbi:hypothetical protein LP419_15180 [Massilia sp. H-1]|nr:hypothetical protein LP419_15180 [Massilia sp. H-1]